MIFSALVRAGYRPIFGENGAAGLEAFLVEPNAIDLVLTDVVMPVMDGITMVQEMRKVRPSIPVLLMSGYPEKVVRAFNGEKVPSISKPFLTQTLIRAVTEVLDSPLKGRGSRSL
jgi:two-component system cell cycle sensor histidine kinase/response regulator CckA